MNIIEIVFSIYGMIAIALVLVMLKKIDADNKRIKKGKKAYWINHTEYGLTTYVTDKDVECSKCHHRQPVLFNMKFCPNCGADMRGKTDA